MFNRIRYLSIIAILFFMQSSTKFVKSQLNEISLDLVVVIHDGMQQDPVRWGKVRDGLNELTTIFKFGDTLTRGMIVANDPGGAWMSIKNVTGNEADFQKAIADTKSITKVITRLDPPFLALDLKYDHLERSTAILLLTTSLSQAGGGFDGLARALRIKDVWIFAIVDEAFIQAEMSRLEAVTDDKSRVIKIGGTTSADVTTALNEFKNKIDGLICSKDATSDCFYTDQSRTTCVEGWYTPNVTLSSGDCTNLKPTPTPTPMGSTCGLDDCNATCEKLWPFAPCVCDRSVDRIGELKWKVLEACDRQLKCEPCPTTPSTTTTPAPTTIPSTIETTTSKAKSIGPSGWYIALAAFIPVYAILCGGG